MTLEEGCVSLKLECALRDLGFVEIGWKVIAHAGLFFVSPVGIKPTAPVWDELLGFQISETLPDSGTLRGDLKIVATAKRALDVALYSC